MVNTSIRMMIYNKLSVIYMMQFLISMVLTIVMVMKISKYIFPLLSPNFRVKMLLLDLGLFGEVFDWWICVYKFLSKLGSLSSLSSCIECSASSFTFYI